MKFFMKFALAIATQACRGEAMMLYMYVLHKLFLDNCNPYLIITARITVHDS